MTTPLFDPAEVRKAIDYLVESGAVFEVRAIGATTQKWPAGKPHIVSGWFDNAESVIKALPTIATAAGIYITLNPVLPDLLARRANRLDDAKGTTNDTQIVKRRALLIDCDPTRPADISSTEQELEGAMQKAKTVAGWLTTQGWPDPAQAMSGNGGHLLYWIDLPADDNGLVKSVLAAVAARFDDAVVTVDQAVFNPARITKLYGTVAAKGDSLPSRPHRLSHLLAVPDHRQIVTVEQLTALAATHTASSTKATLPTATTAIRYNGTFELQSFFHRHGITLKSQHTNGSVQIYELENCPFNADHGAHGEVAVFEQPDGKLGFKCHHNSCRDYHWKEFRAHFEPLHERSSAPQVTVGLGCWQWRALERTFGVDIHRS